MPPPPVTNTKDNPTLGEEPEPLQGPPEDEDLWERYNKRMEFPIATVAAVFLHVVVGAILIYILVGLMDSGEDRSNPPMQIVAVGGNDDSGEGSPGGGGEVDLAVTSEPFLGPDVPAPSAIPDVKDNPPKISLTEPGKLPNPASMGKVGGKASAKGDGVGGTGPGGVGADSTAARGHRWVLRFRVSDAKDYLAQLKALGAEITIPLPPEEKQHVLISDVNNPQQKVITGDFKNLYAKEGDDSEVKRLKMLMSFYDARPNQVREIIAALNINVNAQPRVFRAHFPKRLEDELARLEVKHRNRRPEDIKNTYFRVTLRGGSYEVVVDEQVMFK
jgi:hypothetical protein